MTATNNTRRIVGPFNRVEGDLEVQLDIDQATVSDAWVVSPLYRGYEQILQGKSPLDSLVYVPRICGICSVSQSVAAARALADLINLTPAPNGELATNLILANENLTDHLTHFYLFFMPDFARDVYCNEPWFEQAVARFKAVSGNASKAVLPARAEFLHLMGILAGKWPHSLSLQPGGSSKAIESSDKARLITTVFGFRQFLETTLFGDTLEAIVALDSEATLDQWRHNLGPLHSDFCHFLHIADQLQLAQLGRAYDRFLSYGVYHHQDQPLLASGVFCAASNQLTPLDQSKIAEDVSHTWAQHQTKPEHPFTGLTQPSLDNESAYSWCKAPRLDDNVVEVGALARQVVNGNPLLRDLVSRSGGNVRNRVIARLIEMAQVVIEMESWAKQLRPKEPFCERFVLPKEAQGYGMMEAARGSLGHWLTVKRGKITNYQIVAPTTWNFSPRDQSGRPGALELALKGTPLRPEEINQKKVNPVAVQHIVRSFDPCMVCTVH